MDLDQEALGGLSGERHIRLPLQSHQAIAIGGPDFEGGGVQRAQPQTEACAKGELSPAGLGRGFW